MKAGPTRKVPWIRRPNLAFGVKYNYIGKGRRRFRLVLSGIVRMRGAGLEYNAGNIGNVLILFSFPARAVKR